MKPKHNYLNTAAGLSCLLCSFSTVAVTYIPAGATGFVGTMAYTGRLPIGAGTTGDYYDIFGFSTTTSSCSTFANVDAAQKGSIEAVPGQSGVYGIKLVNTSNPQGGYILAAPNIDYAFRILSRNGGYPDSRYITVVNSKATSIDNNLSEIGPLCYKVHSSYVSDGGPSTYLRGFNLYAVGNLMPGKFALAKPLYEIAKGTDWGDEYFWDSFEPFSFNTMDTIEVLNTCDITPTTPTNIIYGNQLAKNFSTATLVESIPAGITFNCSQSGTSSIFLRPRNQLVATSSTGMSLTPSKSTTTVVPYIVTSLGSTDRSNALCADNASGALKYFNLQNLKGVTAGTPNMLTYYFSLCAKGDIKPDNYTGSMDVQIVVQ